MAVRCAVGRQIRRTTTLHEQPSPLPGSAPISSVRQGGASKFSVPTRPKFFFSLPPPLFAAQAQPKRSSSPLSPRWALPPSPPLPAAHPLGFQAWVPSRRCDESRAIKGQPPSPPHPRVLALPPSPPALRRVLSALPCPSPCKGPPLLPDCLPKPYAGRRSFSAWQLLFCSPCQIKLGCSLTRSLKTLATLTTLTTLTALRSTFEPGPTPPSRSRRRRRPPPNCNISLLP
jgi:hypothetical protein